MKRIFQKSKVLLVTGLVVWGGSSVYAAKKIQIDSNTKVSLDKIKSDVQKDPKKYAGIYKVSVQSHSDEGYDAEIKIFFQGNVLLGTYTWHSWNDSPAVEPSSGPITDIKIDGSRFTGKQTVFGSGGLDGEFVKTKINEKWIYGFLADKENFWKKE